MAYYPQEAGWFFFNLKSTVFSLLFILLKWLFLSQEWTAKPLRDLCHPVYSVPPLILFPTNPEPPSFQHHWPFCLSLPTCQTGFCFSTSLHCLFPPPAIAFFIDVPKTPIILISVKLLLPQHPFWSFSTSLPLSVLSDYCLTLYGLCYSLTSKCAFSASLLPFPLTPHWNANETWGALLTALLTAISSVSRTMSNTESFE